MLSVYAIPVSLYCAKLRITLRHKGLEWEEIPPPGGYGSDEYKTVVPSGNLPALRDGDLLLCDSEAIAEYLEERFPDPPMLNGDAADRARQRDRGRYHDTRLEPAVRALFAYLPGRTPAPEAFLSAGVAAINARLKQLEQLLAMAPGAGETMSLGDCGFPITLTWLDEMAPRMGFTVEIPDGVLAYRRRIQVHPAIVAELADYRPLLSVFLDGS